VKLWVVNHPYRYRRWLKIEARLPGKDDWQEGFIWSEWFGEHDAGDFHVPRVPNVPLVSGNVDPLVIGRHMYFDYCRKGGNGKNERQRNELSRADLILFGCVNQGDLIIDTIFVVGETKQWSAHGIPGWSDLDTLAKRVHFHEAAHADQHPEVHSTNAVVARSYRGESEDSSFFSWVPFRSETPTTTRPLILRKGLNAYRLLAEAYEGLVLEDAMKGSFSVVDLGDRGALFSAIRDEARSQGFDTALGTRLLSEVAHAAPAGGAPCGSAHGSRPKGGGLTQSAPTEQGQGGWRTSSGRGSPSMVTTAPLHQGEGSLV